MKLKKYIIGTVSALTLMFISLINQNTIGLSKGNLESDSRKYQNIKEDWATSKYINDDFGVLLFYSDDLTNHTFSLYRNRPGLSFGYFFRLGGALPELPDDILKIDSNGQGNIYASLNKMQVSKIEITNGVHTKEISIENNKPFTIVIPEEDGVAQFYDIDGNLIPNQSIVEKPL